jgi:hypothetical protein
MESKDKKWTKIEKFYQELVDVYHWDQRPMINLLATLKLNRFYDKYFPSTSHEALGLCTVDQYNERLEQPMIYLFYNMKAEIFEARYQRGQGKTVKQENLGKEINRNMLNSFEEWLSPNASQEKL